MDDLPALSKVFMNKTPIPDAPLPDGVQTKFEGELPESVSTAFISGTGRLGFRVTAPIHAGKHIGGVITGEFIYSEETIKRYADISRTEINCFTNSSLAIGTLPVQRTLNTDIISRCPACEEIQTPKSDAEAVPIKLDNHSYYQGGCRLQTDFPDGAAVTLSLSREKENRELYKMLFSIMIISAVAAIVFGGLAILISSQSILKIIWRINSGFMEVMGQVVSARNDDQGLSVLFHISTADERRQHAGCQQSPGADLRSCHEISTGDTLR